MKKIVILTLLLLAINTSITASLSRAAASVNKDMEQGTQIVAGYLVTATSVLERIKEKKETLIIDTRTGADYEAASIPGSINIPLFAVKTKSFLKGKEIFLVNQGYNCSELENECSNLNRKGFNARIIHGGLNSWRDAGGKIEGDAEAIKALNKVSPDNVYLQEDAENRLIIDLSSSHAKQTDSLIPGAVYIPFDNEKTFIMRISEILNKNKDNHFLSILIINQDGSHYEKTEEVLQKTGARNVFYLEGGLESYRAFLERQALMGKREKVSSKTSNQCCSYE